MAFRGVDGDLWEIVRKYLPPTKPHFGQPWLTPAAHGKSPILSVGEPLRVLHVLKGILYVLTTSCTWHDVPAKYGTKSIVHQYHLELCEKDVYQAIFLNLLRSGYELRKSISCTVRRIPRMSQLKRDRLAMMDINW